MFPFRAILPEPPPVHVVDLGAMALHEWTPPYQSLLDAGLARVTGFEPVAEECQKLNTNAGADHRYLPYAVGDGRVRTFCRCNEAMTSSLYEPNTPLVSLFNNLGELMRVVERLSIQTHRLDDIPEVRDADYLKLDIQGAERDALEAATKVLSSVLVVHTEVEFVPLYEDQPLFAEVDQLLRARGFCFHRFLGFAGRGFKPVVVENVNAMISQMLWADAVYVRDWMQWGNLSPTELAKLSLILHEVYRSYDLVPVALDHYDRQTGAGARSRYLGLLGSPD